jgi:hypothetical protein
MKINHDVDDFRRETPFRFEIPACGRQSTRPSCAKQNPARSTWVLTATRDAVFFPILEEDF